METRSIELNVFIESKIFPVNILKVYFTKHRFMNTSIF